MTKPVLFPFLDQGQKFIIFSSGCLDLSANILIVDMVYVTMKCSVTFSSISCSLKSMTNRHTEFTYTIHKSYNWHSMSINYKFGGVEPIITNNLSTLLTFKVSGEFIGKGPLLVQLFSKKMLLYCHSPVIFVQKL